jgi:tRNA threonylcarbamoyl adenosine modification protein (Sua5/YciO/YrdC/YwlC family)
MAEVLDWQNTAERPLAVARAVEALGRGEIVAFPTETVYGLAASALLPEAVERLRQSKGRPEAKPLTVAVRGAAELLEWAPDVSLIGQRLARRCWPGPLTLVVKAAEQGRAAALPEVVRTILCPGGTVGLRTPAHEAILHALDYFPDPVVLTSANRAGDPPATTAEQVTAAVGDNVALIINDGPSHFGQASTVVKIEGARWEVLREGVLTREVLQKQTGCVVIFACTGNTCRSPLAEALFKQRLADRLGCALDELPKRGFHVLSAGLAAMMGGTAAAEAVEIGRERGADLSKHRSRPLTDELMDLADHLVVMTHSHCAALERDLPRPGPRLRLLDPDGGDIPDPIGCELPVYRECTLQIERGLDRLIDDVLADSQPNDANQP